MPRLSAMHLPLDIYTLISKIRWSTSTVIGRPYKRTICTRPKIYRPRESQYSETSQNTIRFTSCTRRAARSRPRVFIFCEACIRDSPPSLLFRTHTRKTSSHSVTTGNSGENVHTQGDETIFRRS